MLHMSPRADPRLTSFYNKRRPACSLVGPAAACSTLSMADRPLLNLVRAKRHLINLVQAGCRLLDLNRGIRRLVKLQPCPGRSRHVEPCPGPAIYSTLSGTVIARPKNCPDLPPPSQPCPGRLTHAQSCPGRSSSANLGRSLSILK